MATEVSTPTPPPPCDLGLQHGSAEVLFTAYRSLFTVTGGSVTNNQSEGSSCLCLPWVLWATERSKAIFSKELMWNEYFKKHFHSSCYFRFFILWFLTFALLVFEVNSTALFQFMYSVIHMDCAIGFPMSCMHTSLCRQILIQTDTNSLAQNKLWVLLWTLWL